MEMRRNHTTQLMTFPLNYHRRNVLAGVAWRGAPAFYLLMVVELLLKLKCSCEILLRCGQAMCALWEVSRGSKLFPTAHTLHLPSKWIHFEDCLLNLFIHFYSNIFIMSTNASQPKHTHALTQNHDLECKSFFALWTLNMPHSGRCKWMNWICVYWLLYCACVMVKWGRQWWSLIPRIFHSISFVCSFRFPRLPFVRCFCNFVPKILLYFRFFNLRNEMPSS